MWPNPQETAGLVTFTGEILNGKIDFLCSVGKSQVLNVYFIQVTDYNHSQYIWNKI